VSTAEDTAAATEAGLQLSHAGDADRDVRNDQAIVEESECEKELVIVLASSQRSQRTVDERQHAASRYHVYERGKSATDHDVAAAAVQAGAQSKELYDL